jgi:hypothetical protein
MFNLFADTHFIFLKEQIPISLSYLIPRFSKKRAKEAGRSTSLSRPISFHPPQLQYCILEIASSSDIESLTLRLVINLKNLSLGVGSMSSIGSLKIQLLRGEIRVSRDTILGRPELLPWLGFLSFSWVTHICCCCENKVLEIELGMI